MSREGRGGGVCPDCSGRGALAAQAQIPVPGADFLSDRENWCEGTVWGLRP